MKDNIGEVKQPLNVALYARVSTGRQENEQTIKSQLDEVKKRITADGNTLLPQNIFIDDGWSGEMIARPALDLMRDAAKEGRFEALYVYDRGRLSRTFFHQEMILEELSDREIKFISLHDVAAVTPEEKVLQSMQGVFHEYERIKIVERMRRGKLFKARNGVIINGEPLYGFKFVRNDPKEPVRCIVNDDEAKAVKLIWNWFGIDKLSINQIQKKLYDLGIKPKKRKSDFWTKGPIVARLTTINPKA
jgi:site-specific DNA recombinase